MDQTVSSGAVVLMQRGVTGSKDVSALKDGKGYSVKKKVKQGNTVVRVVLSVSEESPSGVIPAKGILTSSSYFLYTACTRVHTHAYTHTHTRARRHTLAYTHIHQNKTTTRNTILILPKNLY